MASKLECPKCQSEDLMYNPKKEFYVCMDCENKFKQSDDFKPLNIFLSYGHDEYAAEALKIKKDLEKRGHKVWFDLERIKEGREWERYIEEGLKKCDKVVLLMTPYSVRRRDFKDPDSKDGYCLNEIAKALEKNKLIIPVLLVELSDGMPTSICRIQYLDLTDSVPIEENKERYVTKFERLTQAIEHDNLDFEGGQIRLHKYLKPLKFEAEIGEHISRFQGREWLIDGINDWLFNKRDSRVFWLRGNPGIGKTAISAYLCHNHANVIAYHLCIHDHDKKSDPKNALLSIAFQIAQHIPEYYQKLQDIEIEEEVLNNTKTIFDNLMVQPLSKVSEPEKDYIVLIDGIDEATKDGKNEIAEFIREQWHSLPSWLRIIITSRPENNIINTLKHFKPNILDAKSPENLEDLEKYIRYELKERGLDANPTLIKELIDKSEGIFLYIVWIFKDIDNKNLSIKDIKNFPDGLNGIYKNFFKRQFPDIKMYKNDIKPILECICAQLEPLPLDILASANNLSEFDLRSEILSNLSSIFPIKKEFINENEFETIRPFHKSVTDWLTGINEETGHFTAENYAVDLDIGNKKLAGACWREYENNPKFMSKYSLSHLTTHLIKIGFMDKIKILLTDLRFVEVKCYTGMGYDLVQDYNKLGLGIKYGALILTARLYNNSYGIYCPYCLSVFEINEKDLDNNINCPFCKKGLKINKFSIKAKWEPFESKESVINEKELDLIKDKALSDFASFVNNNINILHKFPGLTYQQAVNEPDNSLVFIKASDSKELEDKQYITWINKPKTKSTNVMTLSDDFGTVYYCSYSPDGQHIISGSLDGTIKIWDSRTGKEIKSLTGPNLPISDCDISHDGRFIVTTASGSLRIWDIKTGKTIKELMPHSHVINSCNFSPNGEFIVTGSRDKTIKLFSMDLFRELITFKGHDSRVYCCNFSPDSKRIISCSKDKTVKIWDVKTGKLLHNLTGHSDSVVYCSFSPDNSKVISASNDKTLKIWDSYTGEEIHTLKGHNAEINSCAFSPDGKLIVSGSGDRTLKIWNSKTGEELFTVDGLSWIESCQFSPDGDFIISGSRDRSVRIWKLNSIKKSGGLEYSAKVKSCSISKRIPRAISGLYDGTIELWDTETGEEIYNLEGHYTIVNSCAFSPDGKLIVSGSDDNKIKLWETKSGQNIHTFFGHQDAVKAVIFSPNGNIIASGSEDCTIKIWDVDKRKEKFTLKGHENVVSKIVFSPDSLKIVSGSRDGVLKIWDAETGEELHTLNKHLWFIGVILFSPDGKKIISGSGDSTLRVWNAETGQELHTLKKHSNWINSISLSPDGKLIVSGSSDGKLILWDLNSGKYQKTFIGHSSAISKCTFLNDDIIISGSLDKTFRVWDVNSEAEIIRFNTKGTISCLDIDKEKVILGDTNQIYILSLKKINKQLSDCI